MPASDGPVFSDQQLQALNDVTRLLINAYKLICPALLEHSKELARWCQRLATRLGWDQRQARAAFLGGLFHDIGYLATPTPLKDWQAQCPPVDLEHDHPVLGAALAADVGCLEPILPAIRHHHEHWDGSGFPDSLKGARTPALARLVAVAHSYQTLLRGHCSTAPMSHEEAKLILQEDAGVTLDPDMTRQFLDMLDQDQLQDKP